MALWTIKQVAEYLHVNPQTVWKMKKRGDLPCINIARKTLRFDELAVKQYVMSKTSTKNGE